MIKIRYYAPIEEVTKYVASKANGKVLELGPGQVPFEKANHFCGHSEEEKSGFKKEEVTRSIRKIIVKLRMWYADIRGHHGKKWNYEPGDWYMGRHRKRKK